MSRKYNTQREYYTALDEILGKIENGNKYYNESPLFSALIDSVMTGIVNEYYMIAEMQKIINKQNELIQLLTVNGQNMEAFMKI